MADFHRLWTLFTLARNFKASVSLFLNRPEPLPHLPLLLLLFLRCSRIMADFHRLWTLFTLARNFKASVSLFLNRPEPLPHLPLLLLLFLR